MNSMTEIGLEKKVFVSQEVANKEVQQLSSLYLAVICRALQDALSRADSSHRKAAREWIETSAGYGSLSWFCERANVSDVSRIRSWYRTQVEKNQWWQPALYCVRGHCVKHRNNKKTTRLKRRVNND